MLRSVYATCVFRDEVQHLKESGRDFTKWLAVPQSVGGCTFEHRADHNHILKRIATSTRMGKYQSLDLEAFDLAVTSKATGTIHFYYSIHLCVYMFHTSKHARIEFTSCVSFLYLFLL